MSFESEYEKLAREKRRKQRAAQIMFGLFLLLGGLTFIVPGVSDAIHPPAHRAGTESLYINGQLQSSRTYAEGEKDGRGGGLFITGMGMVPLLLGLLLFREAFKKK